MRHARATSVRLLTTAWGVIVVVGLGVMAAACASTSGGGGAEERFVDASVTEVDGDWDDVEAAVIVGAEQSEAVIVRQSGGMKDDVRVFVIRNVLDQRGELTVTRKGANADGSSRIEMRLGVGTFGDQRKQATMLARVAKRMDDLKGREWAPVR